MAILLSRLLAAEYFKLEFDRYFRTFTVLVSNILYFGFEVEEMNLNPYNETFGTRYERYILLRK